MPEQFKGDTPPQERDRVYIQRLLEHSKSLKDNRLQRARETRGEQGSLFAEVTALIQFGEIEQARKILDEDIAVTKAEITDLQQRQEDVQRILDGLEEK